MGNNSPSRALAKKKYTHVAVKTYPYHDTIHKWAVERGTTNTEMVERLVRTYAAMCGEPLAIPEPAMPTKGFRRKFSWTADY